MNSHSCSRCHLPGHYAKKCTTPMPAPDVHPGTAPLGLPYVRMEGSADGVSYHPFAPGSDECPNCASYTLALKKLANGCEEERAAHKAAARKVVDTLREAGLLE